MMLVLFLPGNAWAQVFEALNPKVEQGGVFVFRITPQYQGPLTCISVFGKEHLPNMFGDVFVGVNVETKFGKYWAVFTECGRGVNLHPLFNLEIEVLAKKFPQSRIRRRLVTVNSARRRAEAQEIQNAYGRASSWFERTEGKFINPLDKIETTDQFGRMRVYNNARSRHGGVDLRAVVGTPVRAINSGLVLLVADNFSLEGNVIIIDHGSGILSLYLHLSKIEVAQGISVNKGDIIGLSGETGSVSGPHLHFMIKVNRVNVDPLGFIEMINQYIQ